MELSELPSDENIIIREVKVLIISASILEIILALMSGYNGAKNNPINGNR